MTSSIFAASLRSTVLASTVLVSIAATGCAASTDDSEDSSSTEQGFGFGHGGPGGPGGGPGGLFGGRHHGGNPGMHHDGGGHFGRPGRQHIDTPQGVFFADIGANGSGCPDGTWDVAISPDGQTFTLAFNAYEAQVGPGQPLAMKDCTLDITLNSPAGLSYSVGSFYYQGYVALEKPGMLARQTASYSFGQDAPRNENKNDIGGPFDQSYLFQDDVDMFRRAWSPCGQSSVLHVRTALQVNNDPGATGSGYMNNSTVDGSLSFKWNLSWRQCGSLGEGGGPIGPGGNPGRGPGLGGGGLGGGGSSVPFAGGGATTALLAGPVFDAAWYLGHYPDLQGAFGSNLGAATQHWLSNGINEGRQGSPGFWSVHYLNRYPDLSAAFGPTGYAAAIQHYISNGLREGRDGS
jgi:hypothetical protein